MSLQKTRQFSAKGNASTGTIIDCVGLTDDEYDCLSASDDIWQCQKYSSTKDDLPSPNTVNAIDVFHFDFQQNLPTPKLTVGQQFYKRLLWTWTYLFGIYTASTKTMMAYMWHDCRMNCLTRKAQTMLFHA